MENSKLFTILRVLTKDEFRELEKFIESPYFHKSRDVAPLYNALKNCYPEFKGPGVTKLAVYERMFPGKKYGDKRSESLLSTLSSELYRLSREFLIYSALEENENEKQLFLLRKLREKKLRKEFEKELEKAENKNEEILGSKEGFLESYRYNTVQGELAWDRGDNFMLYNFLLKRNDDALAFALIDSYKFMDTKKTAEISFDIKTGNTFADIILNSLNSEKMLSGLKDNNETLYPYIYSNYLVYMMNKEPLNHEHYIKLKEILESIPAKFGHSEKYMLHQALENYIITELEMKQFKKEAAKELLDVYKNALKVGVHKISPDSYLEPTVFRNIFTAARDTNDLDWAEEFVNRYSDELPDEFAEGMKDYALSSLHFTKGEFEQALKRIVNINYDYPLHKIDAKVLQFRIYYELGDFEHAFSILDTTKHYLSATAEIPEIFKKRNSNFVKYASELLKARAAGKAKDIGFVMQKLKEEKAVESKMWLESKFEAL